jgi:hypothetical protein
MNTFKFGNKSYKYESFWRNKYSSKEYDAFENLLPYPKKEVYWPTREQFLQRLIEIEKNLDERKKFIEYEKKIYKDCLLCGQKNISTKLYDINRIRWEDGLTHYIEFHTVKPTDAFIDFIFRYRINKSVKVKRINGKLIKIYDKNYLRLDRNQILIMDSLMQHGSKRIYIDKENKKIFRYSEHSGLLDFDDIGLDKIIISGKTNRIDINDDEIFMPNNMEDAIDFEYFFHTHPPTGGIGGRIKIGILYEFPSISDIFHFMDHYNQGITQGSIVLTPEGLYIIRKLVYNGKKIKIDDNKFYRNMINVINNIQDAAIEKYGKTLSKIKSNQSNKTKNNSMKITRHSQNNKFDKFFYEIISKDVSYINKINQTLNLYKMHIDYYPRQKSVDGSWIIDTIYLPIYSIEIK